MNNLSFSSSNTDNLVFEDGFELSSNDPETLFQKARELSEQGKVDQIKQIINVLVNSIPTAEIFFQVGGLYQKIKDNQNANQFYLKAIDLDSSQTKYLDEYARFLCSILKYVECEKLMYSQITEGKSNVTVYYWLAESLRLQGKFRSAQISYLMAFSLSPKDVMFRLAIITLASEIDVSKQYTTQYYNNAMEACLKGEFDQAIKYMRDAIMMTTVNPSATDPNTDKGLEVLLAVINKSGVADSQIRDFISLSDKDINPEKTILLAKIKFVEKESKAAFQIIQDGMQKFPENVELPVFYAQNLEKRSLSEALEFLESKIEKIPANFIIRSYCGKLQLELGKYDLALKNLSRAFQINPDNNENNGLLIEACRKTNNLSQAIEIVRSNVLKHGESEESYLLLGNLHAQTNNVTEASTYFQMAQSKYPDSAKGVLAQARMFLQNQMLRDAIIVLREAKNKHQDNPEVLFEYANSLQLDGQLIDATNIYRQILTSDTENLSVKQKLADILVAQGEYIESARYYRDLLQKNSNNFKIMLALAEVYELSGNPKEAQELYKNAIEKNSKFLKAKEKLAICQLRFEDFSQGIVAYEIISSTINSKHQFKTPIPIWKGEAIQEKVLVIYQNLSDAECIMFVRYLPYIKKMGVNLELLVNTSLVRLLQPFADIVVDYPRQADFSLPISAIPKIFNINLERIPNSLPYITPDQILMDKWNKLFSKSKKNRVGLVWRSEKPKSERTNYDRISEIELQMFSDLIRNNQNLDFVSFQTGEKGITEEQALSLPMRSGGQISEDWADLTCGISCVDLLITTDQTAAHLAGALGVKGLVLLPSMANWYWFSDRKQSPWYPSLHLERQSVMGDWHPLMSIINDHLAKLGQT